jgi:predicted RNA-binding Zn ribbon-like protein
MERESLIDRLDSSSARFVGGRLAVDFANSVLPPEEPGTSSSGWRAFIEFLGSVGNLSGARSAALVGLADSAPRDTAALFETALDLREAIRRSLRARIEQVGLQPTWIAQINSILAYTEGYDRLEPTGNATASGFDWRVGLAARSDGLEWLLAAIARSAAELIAEGPFAPIRKCANPKCGLYFYDESRTRRRRWCSMKTCGNRAKVAAHARRKRSSGQAS